MEAWKTQKDRKPLILKGTRQVGKTYILRAFGKRYFSHFHYINFEKDKRLLKIFDGDLNPTRILQELSFYLNASINKETDLIIFDEIQNAPRALTSLKYFHEEMPQIAICCAGSLLGICLTDSAFPVGKVEFVNMFPLSFEEFLQGINDMKAYDFLNNYKKGEKIPDIVHSHLWNQLKIYFVVGGLPEIVKLFAELKDDLFAALKTVREKQTDLIATYNADMAKHSGKQNAMHLERLWRNIPAQLAREQNGTSSKFKFKGVIPGAGRYGKLSGAIDWLTATGLVLKVHIVNSGNLPFLAHVKENSFKLYIFDIGILGALGGLAPKVIMDYDYGSYKGYFAENFVAQEFIYSGAMELVCWMERTAEVEFLREIDGNVLPIETKSGWRTQTKSLKVFTEKYNPEYRTIMSARNFLADKINKVYKCPLYLASRFPLLYSNVQ